MSQEDTPQLTVPSAGCIYGILALAGVAGTVFILDHGPLWIPDHPSTPMWIKVALGAGVGLGVFLADSIAERFIPLFQRMGDAFRQLLGDITGVQAICLALFSSVAEEIFFRGFLQSWLGLVAASILFGVLHIAPDRRLWPWPFLAVAMGFAFGVIFEYTGDLFAPILAHFTINYFGLMALTYKRTHGATPLE
jgi:membrane protease YdiL (CAAX protease family)